MFQGNLVIKLTTSWTIGVRFPTRTRIFLFVTRSRPSLLPLGIKQLELITYLFLYIRLHFVELFLHSPIHLHGAVLKHKDNCALYIYSKII
jgi:hypothetical protein